MKGIAGVISLAAVTTVMVSLLSGMTNVQECDATEASLYCFVASLLAMTSSLCSSQ